MWGLLSKVDGYQYYLQSTNLDNQWPKVPYSLETTQQIAKLAAGSTLITVFILILCKLIK